MNERLAELSRIAAGRLHTVGASDMGDWDVIEKLAKLIIEECICILESERDMYSASEYDPLEYVERIEAKKDALDAGISAIEYHFDI
jgi:hypothetical protein